MNEAILVVRYGYMDLRNVIRLFKNRKDKKPIIVQIDYMIEALLKLKTEINKISS